MPRDTVAHSVTGDIPVHTMWFATVTCGESSVIVIWSLTCEHGPAGSFVVSVSITLPAARSVGDGAYVAFSADGPRLNGPPTPPLQVPPAARPPTLPASWIGELVAHTSWSGPASTVAGASMNTSIRSLTCGQGPVPAALRSGSPTLPDAISAAVGVYVALRADAPGLNEPAPPLHVPPEAPPLTTPCSCTRGSLAQTTTSAPASTTAAGVIAIRTWSLTAPHGPAGSLVVSVSVTLPAVTSAALGV